MRKYVIWAFGQDQEIPYLSILQDCYFLNTFSEQKEIVKNLKNKKLPDLIIMSSAFYLNSNLNNLNFFFLKPFPVLIIHSQDNLSDLRASYQAGVLECLVQPFGPNEFLAKIENAICRYENRLKEKKLMTLSDMLSKHSNAVISNLTFKELKIFDILYRNLNKKVLREDIYREVWGVEIIGLKTLDVHLANLRKKLKGSNFFITSMQSPQSLILSKIEKEKKVSLSV